MQSVTMDSDQKDARMIGIEYIITEKLFKQLPEEEKKLWHSHAYEVKSGTVVAPKLPWKSEHRLMKELTPTYGKSYHFWDTSTHPLPYGIPHLMVAPTRDGIIKSDLLYQRDKKLRVDTEAEMKNREDIKTPNIIAGADSWENGEVITLQARLRHLERAND